MVEEEQQPNQAKIKATNLLRDIYRQISLSANVRLLSARPPRSSRTALTPQRLRKETVNQAYAGKAVCMIEKVNTCRRKQRNFMSNELSWWPKTPKTSKRTKLSRRAQMRLVHAWVSLNRNTEVFSICASAIAFRVVAPREPRLVWFAFVELLKENFISILAFAKTRLPGNIAHIPFDDAKPYPTRAGRRRMVTLHPHEIVVDLKHQKLTRPRFENRYQMNIGNYMIGSKRSKPGYVDPTLRRPTDGECDVCSSKELCDCVYPTFPALFLELFETPDGRGAGVRTLANFAKDTALGAYTGEVFPEYPVNYDPVYSLALDSKTGGRQRASICPKRYGNWARFINHSCDPSVAFVCRTIGKWIYMMIETRKDIKAFEELTIDYGEDYWRTRNRQCLCRSSLCKYKKGYN
ncbi:hypothetical protein AJ78_08168 [Emergomyces pasteurianus Ep9510]|uniref:SET domain-containing protein n=1 Tax=Emergomyces pasteurianus Ep9510 TaxID=1447872 RepID=A0A1J9Q4V6_9EURO|nr:hypothetical protein AJ78_08168 [Emergomyces pasteurianus Ep9510]